VDDGVGDSSGGSAAAVTAFGLLGQVAARCGDVNIAIPAGKQRVLLAALLLRANRIVPCDELADAMWGTAVPPSAEASLAQPRPTVEAGAR
jgi:DNA-binding SARP family transcriptional activator